MTLNTLPIELNTLILNDVHVRIAINVCQRWYLCCNYIKYRPATLIIYFELFCLLEDLNSAKRMYKLIGISNSFINNDGYNSVFIAVCKRDHLKVVNKRKHFEVIKWLMTTFNLHKRYQPELPTCIRINHEYGRFWIVNYLIETFVKPNKSS